MKVLKLLLPLALFFSSSLAYAGPIERATAITAFDEAQALLDQGDLRAACTKFQESFDLDAQLGSLLHLADCREQNGQLASAWGHFLNAAEWAEKQGDERATLAKDRANALAARVSYLEFDFEQALPAGAVIKQNGAELPQALWRKRIAVDTGDCSLEISAAGYQSWTSTTAISGEGTTTRVEIPALQRVSQGDAPAGAGVESNPGDSKSLMARKWPAVVAAGIGIGGGVVWGLFGTRSMKAKSDADDLCGEGFQCVDADGTDLRARAWDAGNIATIGAIVTGVGLGAAGVLWVVLPGSNDSAKEAVTGPSAMHAGGGVQWRVGVQLGGATLAGRF